jgi:hypothetical protein
MRLPNLCLPLMLLALAALFGCQERPLTSQEIQDQHRFMTGCRPVDAARDSMDFEAYCDHQTQ